MPKGPCRGVEVVFDKCDKARCGGGGGGGVATFSPSRADNAAASAVVALPFTVLANSSAVWPPAANHRPSLRIK